MGTIIKNVSTTLSDKLRDKENNNYDEIPKHYQYNLKTRAGLTPRARDQPRVTTLTNPKNKQTNPQEVIAIVTTHYEKEQQRGTPKHLPNAPWTQPQLPDNFTIQPSTPHTTTQLDETLDKYLIKKPLRYNSDKKCPIQEGTRTGRNHK
jgi:hypothetical protein